jgi:hypothetical protein
MSVPAEALAPQPDAPASPEAAPPNGGSAPPESAADPSPAAAGKPSDSTIEPETSRLSERFAELTRLRRDAERDRDHWRDLAMRHQTRESAPAPQQPAKPAAPKTLADFNFDEAAYRNYEREEIARVASEAAKSEFRAAQDAEARRQRDAQFVARAKEFAKDKPDFRDVAYSAPISDAVAETLKGIEQGPELAYYLGKNADIAARLSALPEGVAAFELGVIAQRLKGEREAAAAAAKKVSEAPPPAPTIAASGERGPNVDPSTPDSDKLSDEEWARRRSKQLERKTAR